MSAAVFAANDVTPTPHQARLRPEVLATSALLAAEIARNEEGKTMDATKIQSLTRGIAADLASINNLLRETETVVRPPADVSPLLLELARAATEKEACTLRWLDRPRIPNEYVNEQHRAEWHGVHTRYESAVRAIVAFASAFADGARVVESESVAAQ